MAKSDIRTCPACGGDMARDVRADTISYKGLTADVQQPGWYCRSCDEVLLEPADMQATDMAFLDLKAEADHLLSADEVRRVRRKLNLSQRAASDILGGGPRAFQKYESRTTMVSRPMSNLLRVLDRHPEALDDLRDRRKGP